MKQYQYILLDWDGNIAKTLDVWLDACREVVERRGIRLSDQEIGSSFGDLYACIKKWGMNDVEAVFKEIDEIVIDTLPQAELYPDALEVLEYLHYKKGKKLALITTSFRSSIDPLLEKYDLNKLFATIITSQDVTNIKPHQEPIEKALEVLGGNKNEAIMIGDSDKDLGSARNAGVDSILFYPPQHKKYYELHQLKKHNPTYVIHDFREVMKIVV